MNVRLTQNIMTQGYSQKNRYNNNEVNFKGIKLPKVNKDYLLKIKSKEIPVTETPLYVSAKISDGTKETASETLKDSLDNFPDIIDLDIDDPWGIINFLSRVQEPYKHLKKREYKATIVKSVSMIAESAIAEAKMAVGGAGGAIAGTISRIMGNKGPGTGPIGGYKAGMKMWNGERKGLENKVLGVKVEDPVLKIQQQRIAYEKRTEEIVKDINIKSENNIKILDKAYGSLVNKELENTNSFIKKIEQVKNETIFYQNQKVKAKNRLKNETQAIDKTLEELLEIKKQIENDQKVIIDSLNEKIEEAKKQENIDLQKRLKKELEETKKKQQIELDEITKDVKMLFQSSKIYKNISDKNNREGFGIIAGYKHQINTLLDIFGSPIAREKIGINAEVPGGILFFGPKGNGKTTFAKAFAGQLGCDLVKLSPGLNAQKNIDDLKKIANNAKKRFETDRTRTIILINEFENFIPQHTSKGLKQFINGSDLNSDLIKFIEHDSKDCHCTVFATSNYLENINPKLLSNKRFYIAGLPPANKEDVSAILKHYAEGFADENVNYDELAEIIIKEQPANAFSNSRIKASVEGLTLSEKYLTKKITQDDLQQAIKDKGADINKEEMKLFNKQLDLCSNLTSK